MWRMTAPTRSCRKITAAVAAAILETGLARKASASFGGACCRKRGEVATAIVTVRQKKIWARQPWATEIGVGRR